MFGNRTRIVLLALLAALLAAPSALAGGVSVRDSPTSFVLTIVDYLVHLVF